MSLPDYYQILEVSSNATSAEIKAAYRRLAKIFHPDKNSGNPAAEEKFKQIKDAYENLINPLRRKKYDDKKNRSFTSTPGGSSQRKPAPKKNYGFSEEEAKRRQYYQQQYKTTSYSAPKAKKEKVISNELKYILISVPLAVALLLLVIRLYEKPKNKNKIQTEFVNKGSEIQTPESPYESALAKNIFDTTSHSVIKIVNRSGYDAIFVLKNDSLKTVRHHFLENKYELFVENLPPSSYVLYYWLGDNFSNKNYLFNDISGNFTKNICVDSITKFIKIKKSSADTFVFSLNTNKSPEVDTVLLRRIFKRN